MTRGVMTSAEADLLDCMVNPRLVEKALQQTAEDVKSAYAAVPLHSWEAWALAPAHLYIGRWSGRTGYCFSIDGTYDDELFIICLKAFGHDGEHGKPATR